MNEVAKGDNNNFDTYILNFTFIGHEGSFIDS